MRDLRSWPCVCFLNLRKVILFTMGVTSKKCARRVAYLYRTHAMGTVNSTQHLIIVDKVIVRGKCRSYPLKRLQLG